MKKIRLHKPLSNNEEATTVAKQTLTSRGFKGLQIGDRMSDGTIYAGISPDTGKPMYTTSADVPQNLTFPKAKDYAAKLDAHSHKDWRVPTKAELNGLFDNRAAIGGFNLGGTDGAGFLLVRHPLHRIA